MKLTPAKRSALKWFSENDNAKYWPIGISRSTIKRLCDNGFLVEDLPGSGFGMIVYRVSESGRRALEDGK